MTAIQTEYRFTAKITGKAETPGGTPYLQFDWKLPGDQYAFQLLLGQEKDVYEAWNPGQVATVVVGQGPLKSGKNGNYARDYFWNVESISEGVEGTPTPQGLQPQDLDELYGNAETKPAPERPLTQPQTRPTPGIVNPTEPPPNPAAIGACANHAVDLIIAGYFPLPEGRHIEGWICEVRDSIYIHVNQNLLGVHALHWCYEHDRTHNEAKDGSKWGHRDGDGWCMEAQDTPAVPEANGEPE